MEGQTGVEMNIQGYNKNNVRYRDRKKRKKEWYPVLSHYQNDILSDSEDI